MLDSVKIARRQSEIRQRLAELVGKDSPSDDETRSMESMDTEYRSNETRYRAALIAEDIPRPKSRHGHGKRIRTASPIVGQPIRSIGGGSDGPDGSVPAQTA